MIGPFPFPRLVLVLIASLTYLIPSSQDLIKSFPHDKYVAIAEDNVHPVPWVFLVFINLYKVTHHHKKIDYSFREHVNKNNVMLKAKYNSKSLKGLQVRKEFQLFLQNYTQILLKNHWKEGDYIVDATLKNPGLIYLANAKYLFKGWYIHNPDLLKIALNSLDRKIKPWLILSNNNKLQKIVMSHFYNFEDRYNLIGIIEDPVNSRKYKIYK